MNPMFTRSVIPKVTNSDIWLLELSEMDRHFDSGLVFSTFVCFQQKSEALIHCFYVDFKLKLMYTLA